MAPRTRYKSHGEVLGEAVGRAKVGLHPDAALARDAQLGAAVGGAVGGGAEYNQGTTVAPGLVSKDAAAGPGPMKAPVAGGTAADLGIRTNNREGNPRAGQDFRAFMGGDGLEHHVYAGGQDVAVKPRGTEQSRLQQFRAAVAAREGGPAPGSGQDGVPPGPQDTSGQDVDSFRKASGELGREPAPDLSAVAALPPEQQQALAMLASQVTEQRTRNQRNPDLDLVRRPQRLPKVL